MIRGVTIIMRLCVSRPMPTFLKSRLMYGSLSSNGTPNSLRPSLRRLMPPKSTVPPSGTLTVVVTVTYENVGNCTVVPACVLVVLSAVLFQSFDGSVFAAYGWDPDISDEELLERLLQLNLKRSAK